MTRAIPMLLLVAACGGGTSVALAVAPAPVSPCADPAADPIGCYRKTLDACTGETAAWRLDAAHIGTIRVSESGLIRLDQPGRRLHGVDGRRWLGCLDGCRACVPFWLPLAIAHQMDDCDLGEAEGESWNGKTSRVLVGLCKGRTRIRVRYVPELLPVRDALVRAGVIGADDALARIDGLVVETIVGSVRLIDVREVVPASCADFALPKGKLVASPAAFAELEQVKEAIDGVFRASARETFDRRGPRVEEFIRATLGRACLGQRKSFTDDEIDTCLKTRPDLDPEALAYEAVLAWGLLVQETLQPIMRKEYDAPLCQHYVEEYGR